MFPEMFFSFWFCFVVRLSFLYSFIYNIIEAKRKAAMAQSTIGIRASIYEINGYGKMQYETLLELISKISLTAVTLNIAERLLKCVWKSCTLHSKLLEKFCCCFHLWELQYEWTWLHSVMRFMILFFFCKFKRVQHLFRGSSFKCIVIWWVWRDLPLLVT